MRFEKRGVALLLLMLVVFSVVISTSSALTQRTIGETTTPHNACDKGICKEISGSGENDCNSNSECPGRPNDGSVDWSKVFGSWYSFIFYGIVVFGGLIFLFVYLKKKTSTSTRKLNILFYIIFFLFIIVISFILFLIISSFAIGKEGGAADNFLKGLGINLPRDNPYDGVKLNELFKDDPQTSGTTDSMIFEMIKGKRYKEIGGILWKNTAYYGGSIFMATIGPALGFHGFWFTFGQFIYLMIVGFIAGMIFLEIFSHLVIYIQLGFISKFFDSRYSQTTFIKRINLNIPIAIGIAAVYASLFSIPLLSPVLNILTLNTFANWMPFPFNFIVRIILFAVILLAILIIPGIINWYMDKKKKEKDISDIHHLARGAAMLREISRAAGG